MSKRKVRQRNRVTKVNNTTHTHHSIYNSGPTITDPYDERRLWQEIAIAVASSSNANDKGSMNGWADHAVEAYRRRYGS